MNLRDAWEAEARNWVAWARRPGHDSYWQFHRDRFLELLPPPAGPTLDIGCGEGRFPRDLRRHGYEVTGVDASPTLIDYAREADPSGDYRVADAAALPFPDAWFELVTALLTLHDMDDMEGGVAEAARVLAPGGRLCAAVVHPINSAGSFASRDSDAEFVIRESYFEPRRYADTVERDGLRMTITSVVGLWRRTSPCSRRAVCSSSGWWRYRTRGPLPPAVAAHPLFLHLRASWRPEALARSGGPAGPIHSARRRAVSSVVRAGDF